MNLAMNTPTKRNDPVYDLVYHDARTGRYLADYEGVAVDWSSFRPPKGEIVKVICTNGDPTVTWVDDRGVVVPRPTNIEDQ